MAVVRPASDVTTQWTPSTGSDHYALIDEATASDADYIYATAAAQTDEVKLATLTAPTGNLVINYRVAGVTDAATVVVSLLEGATLIKADTERTADGDYAMTVTGAEYAAVTDWSDIRLRFVSGGGASTGDVLLLEIGDSVLLESGDKILLEA
jgi:hypothetical protein